MPCKVCTANFEIQTLERPNEVQHAVRSLQSEVHFVRMLEHRDEFGENVLSKSLHKLNKVEHLSSGSQVEVSLESCNSHTESVLLTS